MQFDRIPAAMRDYQQWVVWRYEQRAGAKPTKAPYSPRGRVLASVTDPTTWGTFDDAVQAFEAAAGELAGIGFVFTHADPFAGIDLDDPAGDDALKGRQDAVYDAFPSYAELSPSGKGLHIIVQGSVPKGRRRANIEVYSAERFFTMTGNVYRDAPIVDYGPMLQTLWAQMGGGDATFDPNPLFREAIEHDDVILARARSAENGPKFEALWNGNASAVDGTDRSGSAVDQALVNVLAFYSDDPNQVERLWLRSPQGQRDKTQRRADYRRSTIWRAFDRKVPQSDFSAITDKLKGVVDAAKIEQHDPALRFAADDPLPIVNAAALAGKLTVPRSWHVADMVPARTVTLLGGDGGTGKSLLALQLAYATAAAYGWLNTAVRSGDSLFVTAEDDVDEVHRRLADIAKAEGTPLDRLPYRLAISPLAGRDALLAVLDGRSGVLKPTALYQALATYIARIVPPLSFSTRWRTYLEARKTTAHRHASSSQYCEASRSISTQRCCCWRTPHYPACRAAPGSRDRPHGIIACGRGFT